uniref:Reverse transcriptase domain-containing protein n=1 Tax=Fagus sylvatica TaxID=28930 RepID=A0A2N9J5A7_FAGSY
MEDEVRRPLLDGLEFSAISHDDVVWLDRLFDEEEVLGVVQGFNGDKSPHPDVVFSARGDPLSPLLFAIVVEALSRLMDQAVIGGLLSGFFVSTDEDHQRVITHLLLADDTLILCDVVPTQIETYIWNPIIEGMERRLAGWKRLYHSKGGSLPRVIYYFDETRSVTSSSRLFEMMSYIGLLPSPEASRTKR